MGEHAHVEGPGLGGDALADPPEAEQPERERPQLRPSEHVVRNGAVRIGGAPGHVLARAHARLPFLRQGACPQHVVRMGDVTHERDDLADHEVGHGLGVPPRRVEHGDAAAGGCSDVDVDGSAPHAGHQAERGQRRQLLVAAAVGLEDPAHGSSRGAVLECDGGRRSATVDDVVAELAIEGVERTRGELGGHEQRLHTAAPSAASRRRANVSA